MLQLIVSRYVYLNSLTGKQESLIFFFFTMIILYKISQNNIAH